MNWAKCPGLWPGIVQFKRFLYEVTICAESLARLINEIMATLTHEMVHLFCYYAEIKDVGKDGRYHNRKFKEQAEAVGLLVDKDMRLGWSLTSLGPDLAEYVSGLNIKDEVFAVFRVDNPERPKQPTKMKLWTCGCTRVRCAVELKATCHACGENFIRPEAVDVFLNAA